MPNRIIHIYKSITNSSFLTIVLIPYNIYIAILYNSIGLFLINFYICLLHVIVCYVMTSNYKIFTFVLLNLLYITRVIFELFIHQYEYYIYIIIYIIVSILQGFTLHFILRLREFENELYVVRSTTIKVLETVTVVLNDHTCTCNNDICSICLDDTKNSVNYKTQCNHYFHKKCLDEWLIKSKTCPICRNLIL